MWNQNLTSQDVESNAVIALCTLLRELNAKVTCPTVQDLLPRHPNYPSLFSLSEVLTAWNIDSVAVELENVEQLRQLPTPLIAHLHDQNGWLVVVKAINDKYITYQDSAKGLQKVPLIDFGARWSGIILLAETNDKSGEENYTTNHKREIRERLRLPAIWTGGALIAVFSILVLGKGFSLFDWILVATKLTGLVFSGLLIAKQLGLRNDLTDRLCKIHSKINCNDILDSPASKLWGWLSWADIGLLYFSGTLLLLFISSNQPIVSSILTWLALMALPYPVFSVYYQAAVLKKWCSLCLGVQMVLLAEGAIGLTRFHELPLVIMPYLTTATVLLLPAITWLLLKPLLINLPKSRQEHKELVKLKSNPDLFQALLEQQPVMPPVGKNLYPVIVGNHNAVCTITMVTNPFCTPCASVHRDFKQLLKDNPNVKGQIIFACDEAEGQITQVATHIVALSQTQSIDSALNAWYAQEKKNYQAWSREYPVRGKLTDWMSITDQHRDWCRKAHIKATPTLYVNDKKLPDTYKFKDLQWLINELEAV